MKRNLLLIIALILSVIASWAYDVEIDGIFYNLGEINKTAIVTYSGNSYNSVHDEYSGSVTIPETITYNSEIYNVTSIGYDAFSGCSGLTSVTIPNSVTYIGYDAFNSCSDLTEILVLSNNEEFSSENGVLYNKDKTTLIKYPEGKKDASFTIPNSVTSIGDEAFFYCSGLTLVTIGNSVTSIGNYAFANCSGLTSVTIPTSVTSIGNYAFSSTGIYNNNSNWDNGVLYIDNCLIEANSDVVKGSYTIKEGTRVISDCAFFYCSGLTSVTIPTSVTSIADEAFRGCNGLTSVTIPNSVTSIGEYAFCDCSGLTSVTIPNSVTSIGNGAFNDCSGLTSVTIPNSVTSIADEAFRDCSGLTSVTIPNSVTSIGEYAFSDCSGLTSVTIPNSVTSIGDCAFYGCSALTSVTIPNSVTSIADEAFRGCSGLTEILVLSNNEEFSSENGVLYNKDKTTLIKYPEGKKDTSFTIPNSVTSIGSYAFSGCSGLTSVIIPTSVTSIADEAFRGCSGLTSVTIPNSVTSIGDCAFQYCRKLTSVTIGESVTSIGSSAFYGCNNLKTVYNCSSLDIVKGNSTNGYVAYYADEVINGYPVGDFIVNYEDEIIEYIGDTTVNKIEIPEFVTGIELDVFASCANIDTIVWNAIDCADFTETTAPFNAQVAQIKSVIFGNNVEYIPAYLCSDMTLLTEISIPGEVNSIGENAFVGCSRLRYITSYPTLVPLAKVSSFNSYNAYLYIPCDYYDYYYLDDVFGNFKEIKCISAEEVEGSEKVEIEVDSNNNATIIWPSTGNASSYEIVISKNGEVFCTLLFNENGQLTSIDFGNRSASVGFQFTVTGLDSASKYSYSIVAKDEKGNELESYNGTFTTNGYSEETAILETLADANITITGGTISADTDFTIYNTIGQNVTAKNGSLTPGVYVIKVGDNIAKVMVK